MIYKINKINIIKNMKEKRLAKGQLTYERRLKQQEAHC